MRRCAGITLPSHASTATRGFGELARNDNRGAKLIRPQASRVVAIARTLRQRPCCARSFKRNTHREMQKFGEGVAFGCAGAFRIGLQSGGMWHVSALYRPCIGHRTGYSLHENARVSGLASADFEGVFAHSYKRWRPRLFLRALRKASRCASEMTDADRGCRSMMESSPATSPGPRIAKIRSSPRGEVMMTLRRP